MRGIVGVVDLHNIRVFRISEELRTAMKPGTILVFVMPDSNRQIASFCRCGGFAAATFGLCRSSNKKSPGITGAEVLGGGEYCPCRGRRKSRQPEGLEPEAGKVTVAQCDARTGGQQAVDRGHEAGKKRAHGGDGDGGGLGH